MDDVIAEFARKAGFKAGLIRQWRFRGSVPYKHRDPIREEARKENGEEIPTSAFDTFGKLPPNREDAAADDQAA